MIKKHDVFKYVMSKVQKNNRQDVSKVLLQMTVKSITTVIGKYYWFALQKLSILIQVVEWLVRSHYAPINTKSM